MLSFLTPVWVALHTEKGSGFDGHFLFVYRDESLTFRSNSPEGDR